MEQSRKKNLTERKREKSSEEKVKSVSNTITVANRKIIFQRKKIVVMERLGDVKECEKYISHFKLIEEHLINQ